jgi:transcriptional regulator with XRE-family HTH domain
MTIAIKLKRLRKLRRLTATDLSKMSGVHQTTISAIENGKHGSPGIDTVERLAQALRVSPLYFFESRVQTPFDLVEDLPSDIADFLLRAESLPYLLISKKAYEEGISSKTIEQFLKVLEQNYHEKLEDERLESRETRKRVTKLRERSR